MTSLRASEQGDHHSPSGLPQAVLLRTENTASPHRSLSISQGVGKSLWIDRYLFFFFFFGGFYTFIVLPAGVHFSPI